MTRTPFQEYMKFIEMNIFYCTKHETYFHSRPEMDRHLKTEHNSTPERLKNNE